MKKKVIYQLKGLKTKAQMGVIMASTALMVAPVNATVQMFGSTSQIKGTMAKLLNLVFGFFAVMGVVQLALGIYNWVSGAMGDQGDAQKVSKGQGEVVRGVLMVLMVAILNWVGLGPQDIINKYFS